MAHDKPKAYEKQIERLLFNHRLEDHQYDSMTSKICYILIAQQAEIAELRNLIAFHNPQDDED